MMDIPTLIGDDNIAQSTRIDDLVGQYRWAEAIFRECKEAIPDNALERAISLSRRVTDTSLDSVTQSIARRHLSYALLIRFLRYGWHDDLDQCEGLLSTLVKDTIDSAIVAQRKDSEIEASEFLDLAAGMIKECRQSIDARSIENAIALFGAVSHSTLLKDFDLLELLVSRSSALLLRYLACDDAGDLEAARLGFLTVLESVKSPAGAQHLPRCYCLSLLELVSFLQFLHTNNADDLLQAMMYRKEAKQEDQEARDALNVAKSLLREIQQSLDISKLNKAKASFSRSLDLRPQRHPLRDESLDGLAYATQILSGQAGYSSHIDNCIALYRQVVALRLAPHPARYSSLDNLAGALNTRFHRTADTKDLDECIALKREALHLMPAFHPDRFTTITDLAAALSVRFDRGENNPAIVDECISLNKEALELVPPPHPGRPFSLICLSRALANKFGLHHDLADLENAIEANREALDLRPAPHPDRAASLSSLSGLFRTKFNQRRDLADLKECHDLNQQALDLTPTHHPHRHGYICELADTFLVLFNEKNDREDLQKCIALRREVLNLTPASHASRASCLNDVATALCILFECDYNLRDLEEAISLYQQALDLRPAPHPRAVALKGLAAALYNKFQHRNDPGDLEKSIVLCREAVALALNCGWDSAASLSLNDLAAELTTRFHRIGEPGDLEEAIASNRQALTLIPASHRARPTSLNYLSHSLSTRFYQKGDLSDLEESITVNQQALDLAPPFHPKRWAYLLELAVALGIRFREIKQFPDLERSILLRREALALRPVPHLARAGCLDGLAGDLLIKFRHQTDDACLEECIALNREALSLRPVPHPSRNVSLQHLSSALFARFNWKHDDADLGECIMLNQEALDLMPVDHTDRPDSLISLALALRGRFSQRHNVEDLDTSIVLHREALELTPPPDPARASALAALANALVVRCIRRPGDNSTDLEEAMSFFQQVAEYQTCPVLRRLRYCIEEWASSARNLYPTFALAAYKAAVKLLPLLSSHDMNLRQRQTVLSHTKNLASKAARCAIEVEDFEAAVMFLFTARSVFWSQALQLRTPLEQLNSQAPHLAERLRTIASELEQRALQSSDKLQVASDARPIKSDTYYRILASEWQNILEEVRQIKGFEEFLRPPSFSTLQRCALKGPVVLLNANRRGCDALIITMDNLRHVPLPKTSYDSAQKLGQFLQLLIAGVGYRSDDAFDTDLTDIVDGTDDRSIKSSLKSSARSRSSEDHFRDMLKVLWTTIVHPIVQALELEKSGTPTRVWWCPTGPFSFLPIHAAGDYKEGMIDCLSDYAISSYCSSLQDLLEPPPTFDLDFKMLSVIQPEVPGVSRLPKTLAELDKIIHHLPQPHDEHLIKRVGNKNSPTTVQTILSDLSSASMVHFGCHGTQDLTNPLESGLLLSGGKLKMSGIIQCKNSKASLAYLSACETAKGDQQRPNEGMHLAATMMFAGFRSVVGTLWSIWDEDAPAVADVFYAHLFRNGSSTPPDVTDSAYALHLAVKALQKQPGMSFRRWVPFVHFGI